MIKENGKVTMPFGVMGGQYQANGHVRFISNVYDYGMDVQTAIDFPRSFAEKGTLSLELGYSEKIASELEDMGHTVVRPNIPIGGAQAVQIDYVDGVLKGGSDPRKDGLALGY
jgi:gamma-glutamyltranspeptidase/glutathione hydrolase